MQIVNRKVTAALARGTVATVPLAKRSSDVPRRGRYTAHSSSRSRFRLRRLPLTTVAIEGVAVSQGGCSAPSEKDAGL
eukprot:6009667-Pleurochrysis_carterae.AAC.1